MTKQERREWATRIARKNRSLSPAVFRRAGAQGATGDESVERFRAICAAERDDSDFVPAPLPEPKARVLDLD